MESQSRRALGNRAEPWLAVGLCVAVLAAGALKHLVRNRPAHAGTFAPEWLALAAVGLAAAGFMPLTGGPLWLRVRRALLWSGFSLMVWAAQGFLLDLFRLPALIGIHLMPAGIDWPAVTRRMLALAAAVVLARLALARPADAASPHAATWYGYAAFVLALPYPVLRTWWALGGTPGLLRPGAAGPPWAWLACIPWLLAALLSLLLVPTWRWMPRRLLLAAGWFATAVVASIGPVACWTVVTKLVLGTPDPPGVPSIGMAMWVPCLFYGSWLLWAIAAGAATRSYQLRSAALR